MSKKVNGCPFCGNTDIDIKHLCVDSYFTFECNGEGCWVSVKIYQDSEDAAVAVWNRRVAESVSRIQKQPLAYAIYLDNVLQDVTKSEAFANDIANNRKGRTVVPLYDHPSKEAMREFAKWLREGDEPPKPWDSNSVPRSMGGDGL